MSVTQLATSVLDGIYKVKDDSGRAQWEVFHDLPPAQLSHYYAVMRRPMSLTIIRKNIRKGAYATIQEFVRDVAQIVANAKTYNDRSTIYWQDADAVERYVRSEVPRLREATGSAVSYPSVEPVLKTDASGDELSDGLGGGLLSSRARRRRSTRNKSVSGPIDSPPSSTAVTALKRDRDDLDDDSHEGRKKRGRPPTVDKPHEHRIKAILRAVRRVRDDAGRLLSTEFEKVPDQRTVPEYHQVIEQPLALDGVRKTIKRRGYATVDQFLADMNLIFANAKQFVGDEDHPVYQDAVVLQQVMNQTAEEEKKKPDSAYADPDSNSKVARLPLDSVMHRDETYKVGDWVHISNPNDPAKPTVGQIFRLWRENGKTWANCCWYYRPEQTVHKWDKLFWENEVVKSGQYRDHLVDDILEKCFVMFITKYQRGRPKDIGNRSVYLCESRYNEGEKTFNRIRTWKACIPDEIRNSDFPMDMFDKTKTLRRVYSPLRNELPADAKDTDPVPNPIMGDPMAPPLRGAVYKRPFDPDDPPEEPTPPSPNPQEQPQNAMSRAPMASTPQLAANGGPVGGEPATVAAHNQRMHSGTPQFPGTMPMPNPRSGPVPMNTRPMFRGAGPQMPPGATGPPQTPSIIPAAYVLPEQFTNRIDEGSLAAVAKMGNGMPLWFPSCPVAVTHRIQVDPLPPSLRFDLDGETKRGVTPAHGFGHSARYLAWKLEKLRAAQLEAPQLADPEQA